MSRGEGTRVGDGSGGKLVVGGRITVVEGRR